MTRKGQKARAGGALIGGADYRNGAIERLDDARILLDRDQFAGSIYLAGRAVEGMLRAIVWRREPEIQQGKKSLETGHDLRDLLALVENLGLLTPGGGDEELKGRVVRVSHRWFNNMRFVSSRIVEARWGKIGVVRKGTTFKQAARGYFDDCAEIVKRCERLWQY